MGRGRRLVDLGALLLLLEVAEKMGELGERGERIRG